MKHILFIFAFMATAIAANAQSRGPYGTIQAVSIASATYVTPAGVTKAHDTLVNADTGYVVFPSFSNVYDMAFNVTVTPLTGTAAGTVVLQGSDNSTFTTPWAITGNVTQCASCTGASGTVTTATTTYKWIVPSSPFQYYRVRVITTGTSTATYSSTLSNYRY